MATLRTAGSLLYTIQTGPSTPKAGDRSSHLPPIFQTLCQISPLPQDPHSSLLPLSAADVGHWERGVFSVPRAHRIAPKIPPPLDPHTDSQLRETVVRLWQNFPSAWVVGRLGSQNATAPPPPNSPRKIIIALREDLGAGKGGWTGAPLEDTVSLPLQHRQAPFLQPHSALAEKRSIPRAGSF